MVKLRFVGQDGRDQSVNGAALHCIAREYTAEPDAVRCGVVRLDTTPSRITSHHIVSYHIISTRLYANGTEWNRVESKCYVQSTPCNF